MQKKNRSKNYLEFEGDGSQTEDNEEQEDQKSRKKPAGYERQENKDFGNGNGIRQAQISFSN